MTGVVKHKEIPRKSMFCIPMREYPRWPILLLCPFWDAKLKIRKYLTP